MKCSIAFVSLVLMLLFSNSKAQDLENVLNNAEKRTQVYREKFRNLAAIERGELVRYDSNGNRASRKTIESNFIVYQSVLDSTVANEYRHIIKFNDKPLHRNEKRSIDLFQELQRSKSVFDELRLLNAESLRFEDSLTTANLTLIQAPILAAHIRPFFDFKLAGFEMIDGRNSFKLSYRQTSKCPFILVNAESPASVKLMLSFDLAIPSSIKELNERLYGTLWIDTETFQIRREERLLSIKPDDSLDAFNVFTTSFSFREGKHKILEPSLISATSYTIRKTPSGYKVSKDSNLKFEYSNFSGEIIDVKASGIGSSIIVEK